LVYGSWQADLPVRWWKTQRRFQTTRLTKKKLIRRILFPYRS
jgi:hypothetical protein